MPPSIFQLVVLPYLSASHMTRALARHSTTLTGVPLQHAEWEHHQSGVRANPNSGVTASSQPSTSSPFGDAAALPGGSLTTSRRTATAEQGGIEEPQPPDRTIRIPQTRRYASLAEYSLCSDETLSLIDDFPLESPVGNPTPPAFPLPPIRPGPRRHLPPAWASPSPSFGGSDPPHFRTAAIALKRIIETYTPPAELPTSLPQPPAPAEEEVSENTPELPVSDTVAASGPPIGLLSYETAVQSAPEPASGLGIDTATTSDHRLPPILHQLLRRGVYRLAVFHFQSSQEYYTSRPITTALVNRLEAAGQFKLADRIRLSVDEPKSRVVKGEKRLRLSSAPRSAGVPSHYSHRDLCHLPFPSIAKSRGSTPREQITAYYNSQINHLLHKPPPSPKDPIDTGPRFPSPSPRLQRLSKLLRVIGKLEKDHGFAPDRQTANLVLLGWLQCGAAAIPKVPLGSRRMVERPDGEVILEPNLRKMGSFTHRDLRTIFRAVSLAMDPPTSDRSAVTGSPGVRLEGRPERGPAARSKAGGQAAGRADWEESSITPSGRSKGDWTEPDQRVTPSASASAGARARPPEGLHYHRHVKPFCEMMKRHMWLFRDLEGARAVGQWQLKMKGEDGAARKKREEEGGVPAWYI